MAGGSFITALIFLALHAPLREPERREVVGTFVYEYAGHEYVLELRDDGSFSDTMKSSWHMQGTWKLHGRVIVLHPYGVEWAYRLEVLQATSGRVTARWSLLGEPVLVMYRSSR